MTEILVALISAAFAAGGAYMAVRVELRFVWRDMGRHDTRIASLEKGALRRHSDLPMGHQ